MRRVAFAAFASMLALVAYSQPAAAQATRTWVSGVGDDVNPCSRTAPCKTFAGAISKTIAGGEISTLDPGGFGAVTITKSISITNDNSGEAGILASSTNGIIINAAATDVINIRGVVIDGAPPTAPGLNGIRFLAGGALHVQNCVIKNFRAAAPNGHGVLIAPTAGTVKVFMNDCVISNNGTGTTGAGIQFRPTGSAAIRAVLKRLLVEDNTSGIHVDTGGSTGASHVTISDSVVTASAFSGIAIVSNAAALTRVAIERTLSTYNSTGINSIGTAAIALLGTSVVTGNTTGLAFSGGGQIFSYQNNHINGNFTTEGAPSGTLTPQ
jgi:hypothetical protein